MRKAIGVFDSGLGGLTVAEYIRERMPEEDILFFADSKNMPYGDKTKEELRNIAVENVRYLNTYPLKALVIACNTMDSTAPQVIRENTTVPVYGVIRPAVEKALLVSESKKIGVIATRATVKSGAYRKLLKSLSPDANVTSRSCPLLTPMIEDGSFRDREKLMPVLEKYLSVFRKKGIDTLILGCTHYPIVAKEIEEILPGVTLVSSSYEVVNVLNEKTDKEENKKGRTVYLTSKDADGFSEKAQKLIHRKVRFREV